MFKMPISCPVRPGTFQSVWNEADNERQVQLWFFWTCLLASRQRQPISTMKTDFPPSSFAMVCLRSSRTYHALAVDNNRVWYTVALASLRKQSRIQQWKPTSPPALLRGSVSARVEIILPAHGKSPSRVHHALAVDNNRVWYTLACFHKTIYES